MNRIARLVVGLLVVAGPALAGTPLPDPPFSSGGFVPPSSLVLRQEQYVEKLIAKYSTGIAKCDQVAVIGLQLGYEPENMQKVPELQAKWQLCRQKVSDKYVYSRDLLLAKGMPACLDQAGIDGIRAQIDFQFPLLAPFIYCDGDAAAPDPVTGINIPDFKNEAVGEVAAAKVVTKAGLTAGKCYTLAAKYAAKLGGTLPPDVLLKITTCLDKAQVKSDAAMAKLDQTQKLPACLSLATAQGLGTAAIGLAGQFSDETYCASPSGAFLD